MRIIVTGVSSAGDTIVVRDDDAGSYGPKAEAFAAEFIHILGSDSPVRLPFDGTPLAYGPSFFPTVGGFRFWILTMPAHSAAPPVPAHPPTGAEPRSANAGMAYADTVEWVIVLSGEIEHVLPDGKRLPLKTSDSIVQAGALHRWENNSDTPCVMAVAAIGASAAAASHWMQTPA